MKIRLDEYLVKKKLTSDIALARSLAMEGRVFLGQERLTLPSIMVEEDEARIYIKEVRAYVSRGGYKLEKAIAEFSIDLSGKTCMDIGSSTGGFTDCMLKNGAEQVYAIDVGYGLLDWGLRNDPRVSVMERTNARKLTPEMFKGDRPSFASMDVSFISIKAVLPAALCVMEEDGELVMLVKPQFEAAKESVGRGGIVRDRSVHEMVLDDMVGFVQGLGLQIGGLCPSPIKGTDGNIEFLLYAGSALQPATINIAKTLDFVWN